jgi:hypothetical protein
MKENKLDGLKENDWKVEMMHELILEQENRIFGIDIIFVHLEILGIERFIIIYSDLAVIMLTIWKLFK